MKAASLQVLAYLALLAGGGCLVVPPPGEPSGAGASEAATGTTGAGSSAGQSETGIVAPATSTSTAGEITTSAASGATSEAATTFDTFSFIIEPDGGGEPLECDIFAQDCPRGQKCMPYAQGGGGSWNATKCVDVVDDPKQVGEACTAFGGGTSGEDDCDLGAMCWDVDEEEHGVCIATCGGTVEAPICPPSTYCTGSRSALSVCIPICDPLVQDCPGDEVCIPNGDLFVCVFDGSGEQGQAHDVCEFANACDEGLLCLDSPGASSQCDQQAAGCCEPFCMFPDGPCPAADQKCVQWFDPQMLPPDDPYLAIGVCAIPP